MNQKSARLYGNFRVSVIVRRLLPAFMGLMIIGGLVGFIRLTLYLGEPFPGFALFWRKEIRLLSVFWNTPSQWPGMEAGMKLDDRILCIDDYCPDPSLDIYGILPQHAAIDCPNGSKMFYDIYRDEYFYRDGKVDILVDRRGTFLVVPNVPLVPFTMGMLLDLYLPFFLLGSSLLVVGAIVYRADPAGEINLVFAMFTTIAAGYMLDWTLVPRIVGPWIHTPLYLFMVAPWLPLVGVLLFHLTGLISDQKPFRSIMQKLLGPYYIASFAVSIISMFIHIWDENPSSYKLTPLYFTFLSSLTAFGVLWALASMGWTAFKGKSIRVRRQARLMLLAFFLIGLIICPLALLLSEVPPIHIMPVIPFVALAAFGIITYAILRYQVFQTKEHALVMVVLMVMCVSAATIVYLLAGQVRGFMPLLAVALLTGVALELRGGPAARLMRRETLDYQRLVRLSKLMTGAQEIESILAAVTKQLKADLEVDEVNFWLIDPDRHIIERHPGSANSPVPDGLVDCLKHMNDPVRADSPAAAECNTLPGKEKVQIWVPLSDRDEVAGVIGLGPRWTGDVFDHADLQCISIFAHQLALALLNIRQMERLKRMSRMMIQAEENERRKIARELHDTILQFLLVLTYGLDELKEQTGEAAKDIEHWQDRISAESDRLRKLLSVMRAPERLVEDGLAPALQVWLDLVRQDTKLEITTQLDSGADNDLSTDARLALYRVIREAVHNAVKYSDGSQIEIKLGLNGIRVLFSVEDDGKGFELEQALLINDKGYNSLYDLKVYLESVGGQLSITTFPGEGTRISGWAPASCA
ncbi:MAG: hypothetical protein JXA42_09245 [Anaerolineales bacterium]|nr:hypothetical protein [Anaerolineales bacterium]